MGQIGIKKFKAVTLGFVGVAVAGLLTRTVKGIVSFVQNLLPSQTQKEVVRPVPKASRLGAIFQTAGIGAIYGLLFAGLLLMPFQSHRVAAASPAEDTVETQAAPPILVGILIGIGINMAAMALWKGGEWVIEEIKTPNGTIVATADIVLDELDGERIYWYGVSGSPVSVESFDETNITAYQDLDYAYYDITVEHIKWDADAERYRSFSSDNYYGNYDGSDYFPAFLNGMFNYAKPGDADTGIPGFFISWGSTFNQDVTHAFDSNVDESQRDNLLAKQDDWKYNPTVFADLSDMRYQKNADGVKVWTYTPRLTSEEYSEEMSAEADGYCNGGYCPQKHTTRPSNNVQKQKQGVLEKADKDSSIWHSRNGNI